jgi:hypothetical protein
MRGTWTAFQPGSPSLPRLPLHFRLPLQQESKALTRVRSQIRGPAISSSSAGPTCRFNDYDECCSVEPLENFPK